jgi:hypothetical protein
MPQKMGDISKLCGILKRQGTGRNRVMTRKRIILFLSLTRQNDK